jgi:biotin operon repressor
MGTTPKNAYIPATVDKPLSPAAEKYRETYRFMYIIKHHQEQTINDMARAMKIGYTQVVSRIQALKKKGITIIPYKSRRSFAEPNWEVVQREFEKLKGKK